MDAQIDAAWRESVEAEVKCRLAERGLTVQTEMVQQQSRAVRDVESRLLTSA
jgi:hypothetical protein